jgi:regulation of enolase protein 1 (concanavalin A-like superfamily)
MELRIPELPFPLRSYGPEGNWSYEDGTLTGWAGPRQDRFVPPTGDSTESVSDAPRLLGAAPEGDFQLVARVTVGFAAAFDAGVLYVHVGDREWAKLCFERSPDEPTICTVVTRGHSDDANAFEVPGRSVWLRVSRTGAAFAFHASTDGRTWTFVRIFTLGDEKSAGAALVGFLAQSPVGEGCVVTYDHVEYRDTWPTGLRDGS